MNHEEKALNIFNDKFNCSQAVLGSFAEEMGMTQEQAMNVALCFSAGMREGEVCGAVSGAMMVLGLIYGRIGESEDENKKIAYEKAKEFMEKFRARNGSYICKEILHCDISTDEGRAYAIENDVFNKICPVMVKEAVKLLDEIR